MRASFVFVFTALLLVGCEDPGAEVTAAKVEAPSEARPSPSDEPAGTSASFLAISPSNSKVEFVGAKVTASHPGGFTDFAGKVQLAEPLESSKIEVTIQTASLFADKEKLAKHLRSPDFFDVAQFPTATFRSTEIRKDGQGHVVSGELTLHGVTKQISFPASVSASDTKLSASAEFSIDRKDFGINYPGMQDDLIRDLVVIKLSLDLPRG